jgi:hypothetical protein
MSTSRPGRFGAQFDDPAPSVVPPPTAVPPPAEPEPVAVAESESNFEAPTPPTPIRVAAAPKKKPAAKQKPATAAAVGQGTDLIRKHVEWTEDIDFDFQDGCDSWYVEDKERKRRLRRRPSDNQLITALVRVGLKAIEDKPEYNALLEELLPVSRSRTS